jgi:hypothetical protein
MASSRGSTCSRSSWRANRKATTVGSDVNLAVNQIVDGLHVTRTREDS